MTIQKIVEHLKRQEQGVVRNKPIFRWFYPTERYIVDFADDFSGWQQYNTDQDAHYFGVWVNPEKLLTLTYAEGDWSLVVCENIEQFNEEIKSLNDFYGEGFEFKTINETGITEYRQDREKFYIV